MPTRSRFATTIIPCGTVGLLSVMLFMSGCGGGSGSGGGAASFSVARGIAADSGGNVYVAGDTNEALGGESTGSYDMFVIKRTPGDGTEWIQQFGSALYETAQGIAVDLGGNIYVAGYTNYNPENPTGFGDSLLLVKYDGSGAGQWYFLLGTNGDTGANAVSTDDAGNVVVAGFTWDSVDGTPNAGRQDLFVISLDGDGNYLWSRQMGTPTDDHAVGVSVDPAGNSFVAGSTGGSLDGNASVGGNDLFLIKFDRDGNKLWSRQAGTSGNDYAKAVATDIDGNAIVVGYTYGSFEGNANAGQMDLFVVTFDPDGNTLWSRQMGTPSWDSANAVATDGDGNIYVAGETYGGLDGNINAGAWDLFLVKFDRLGNKQWTRQTGGAGDDSANGVVTDGNGMIHAAGGSSNSGGTLGYLVVKYDSAGNRR